MSTQNDPRTQAAEYMDRMLEIIKRRGLGGDVSAEQYAGAVDSVAATFEDLLPGRDLLTDHG